MRQPKPFYRKQTASFYVQIDGQQINLGPDETEAYRQWHLLMAGADENVIAKMNEAANKKPESKPQPITIHKLVKSFLRWVASQPDTTLKPSTRRWYKKHLESFVSTVDAELAAENVTQADVDRWFRKHGEGWGDNYRLQGFRSLARVYNWGRKRGHVKENPIRDMERPSYQPRDCYLTNEQWSSIIGATTNPALIDSRVYGRCVRHGQHVLLKRLHTQTRRTVRTLDFPIVLQGNGMARGLAVQCPGTG